jgi:RimJ/RimL family protein N-acetyltransferase
MNQNNGLGGEVTALAEPRSFRELEADQPGAWDAGDLRPPPRTGRWVSLAPVSRQYMEFLYQLATNEENGFRWLLAGTVPPAEVFQQNFWKGVLTQFVVLVRSSSAPIGIVVAYNAEINHGFAYLGADFAPNVQGIGIAIEAVELFVDYLFATYNLRKLYLEVPEYNLGTMANGIGGVLREEGVLREHTYYRNQYWDRHVLALYREEFLSAPKTARGRRRSVFPSHPADGQ